MIPREKIEKKEQGKMLFEFQVLRGIDHPHIIRIFEIYTDPKYFYLITEYVPCYTDSVKVAISFPRSKNLSTLMSEWPVE